MEHGQLQATLDNTTIALKDSLKTKLILLTTGFIVITALTLTYLYTEGSDTLLLQQYSKQRLLQERLHSTEMFRGIQSSERDIQILRNSPTLLTLLEQLQDKPQSASTKQWKDRLAQEFFSYMKASHDYMQLRLIGVKNGGREIVRVDRTSDGVVRIPEDLLQNKGDRDYYRDILQLGPDDVYTSEINLNREFGKISLPHTPTIRIATPLYTDRDTLYAMLIININLADAFTAVKEMVEPNTQLFIVNEYGDYLVNPDPFKEFAFDFGRIARLQDDFPALGTELNHMGFDGLDREVTINGKRQYLHAIQLANNKNIGKNKMYAIQLIPRETLFDQIAQTERIGHVFAAIFTIVSIAIALLLAHSILAPIQFLTLAAVTAANGNYARTTFPEGRDEIGLLSRTFRVMIERVKNRETEILDKQARYKAIFSGAEDGIVIVDKYGNIEEANDAFCQLSGVAPDKLKSCNLINLIKEARAAADLNSQDIHASNIKQLCSGEIRLITQTDTEVPVFASSNEFTLTTGEHYASYIHDLRRQKTEERERMSLLFQLKQAQKLESIGLMASGIAHDFNNVLSCISGFSDLMKIKAPLGKAENDEYLDQIITASDKAKQMIRNLMRFCRSDTSKQTTSNTQHAILDIIAVLQHALTSRIILSHNIEPIDGAIGVAPFQLQQLILNLCINAKDAMDGSGHIHITSARGHTNTMTCRVCGAPFHGEFLQLAISDKGPGIDPGQLQQIFEPFYTTKPEDKGTGLGLYMVQTIVHESGGHIGIDTSPDNGTTFRIFFPIIHNDIAGLIENEQLV